MSNGVSRGVSLASIAKVYTLSFLVGVAPNPYEIEVYMRSRKKEIILWLSDEEYEKLKTQVAKTGLSMQSYLRTILKQVRPKERPPLDLIEVLRNLSQINNNMNQIAAKANSIGFIDTRAYWKNVHLLEDTIKKLTEEMYG